jgi:hypothetical protein
LKNAGFSGVATITVNVIATPLQIYLDIPNAMMTAAKPIKLKARGTDPDK